MHDGTIPSRDHGWFIPSLFTNKHSIPQTLTVSVNSVCWHDKTILLILN